MNVFIYGFWISAAICAVLYFMTRTSIKSSNDTSFIRFQYTYVIVYVLAMGADWLQGPYVYALYENYKMTSHQIDILFVVGFGSSMLVGTVIGSFADKYGRRKNAILYAHFNNFWILLIGRLMGGIATSILYSAFESWLVYEHNKRGYDADLLGTIFSQAIFTNSISAIFCGIIAQVSVDNFGFVAPFDVSLCVLIILSIVISMTWSENYGDTTVNVIKSFKNSVDCIKKDKKILCLGLIQSLYEASMYTFVLKWTPALEAASIDDSNDGHTGKIPHGYVFAGFMVAVMIGSCLFKFLSNKTTIESFMRGVLFIASISLIVPVFFDKYQSIIYVSFIIFEVTVGIFWPSMSSLRGKYVPEATRATVMNCFRVPLNLIVVIILTQNFRVSTLFKLCSLFLALTCICQEWLYRLSNQKTGSPIIELPLVVDERSLIENNGNDNEKLTEKLNLV